MPYVDLVAHDPASSSTQRSSSFGVRIIDMDTQASDEIQGARGQSMGTHMEKNSDTVSRIARRYLKRGEVVNIGAPNVYSRMAQVPRRKAARARFDPSCPKKPYANTIKHNGDSEPH